MGRSYSLDLRRGDRSHRGTNVRLTGARTAGGAPPGTGKLAPYRDFLIERVKEKPDIAMLELAAELETHYGIEADPASLSAILHACFGR